MSPLGFHSLDHTILSEEEATIVHTVCQKVLVSIARSDPAHALSSISTTLHECCTTYSPRFPVIQRLQAIADELVTLTGDLNQQPIPYTGNVDTAQRVIDTVYRLFDIIEIPPPRYSVPKSHIIPLSEIPEVLRYIHQHWPDFALPPDRAAFRGGVARTITKIYALTQGLITKDSLIESEFPCSDYDVVITKDVWPDKWRMAEQLRTNPGEILILPDFTDLSEYYMGHVDMDINQCLLTNQYLYCTEACLQSMVTGNIHYLGQKEIRFYQEDFYQYDEQVLLLSTVLYRYAKMTAEGKARFFELPEYNLSVPVGENWLWALSSVCHKQNGTWILARLCSIAKQMGQCPESNIVDFVRRLLQQYPDYTIIPPDNSDRVAIWYVQKLFKYIANLLTYQSQKESWARIIDFQNTRRIRIEPREDIRVSDEEQKIISTLLTAIVK